VFVGRGVFGGLVGRGVFGGLVGFGVFGAFHSVGRGVFGGLVGFGVFGGFVGRGVGGAFQTVGRGVFGGFVGLPLPHEKSESTSSRSISTDKLLRCAFISSKYSTSRVSTQYPTLLHSVHLHVASPSVVPVNLPFKHASS